MSSHQVQLLFVDLALIVIVARLLGRVAARYGQPAVIGEILGGILLGPTVLGGAVDTLFPAGVRPVLTGLADVGVALFMFTVGLEIETRHLRGRGRLTAGTALGSMLVPFSLGVAMAFYLLRNHPTDRHGAFIVFVGLSVSVTAFPVLARILTDRGLSRTALGGIALATAAVVDVLAWTGLAGVQAAAAGGGDHWRLFLAAPYLLAVVLVVRPLLRRLVGDGTPARPQSPSAVLVVLVGILLSAAATEAMGLHFIFGAFIFGLATPKGVAVQAFHTEITEHVGRISGLLLPVYFMVAGLGVDLRHFGATQAGEMGVILLVAVAGKFGGTYVAARLLRLPGRPACALAALMNTRGLTELVILGVGRQLGLLDGPLYSLMVVMAVVTTMMTGPLLNRIYHRPVEVPEARVVRRREEEKAAS
ncbi:cation:proton antiporter [Streptomyces cocklensis]|uniref:Kef-type K+ transport system, membrane component KefB n=1 Tax=Actinacidiphila cocklensis TaxID=887465 RepID=A0A9W4GNH7_9ACTN|nr:cation:proton antiporter [Actinacidiphila cocklensis]MDD1061937.1 cation:proton antiporter [Actinacidiphila cocklensis]CAG6391272.1 Kef-type K+ transport system, membrane component KefB [Actinacidiphila cocklensis]